MNNLFRMCLLFILLLAMPSFAATLVPSDLMRNPNQWKITYPDGTEDKTLAGEPNNEYFHVSDNDSAIVFFVPIRTDNGTTPNTHNIRSELRERTEDGSADIYWTTTGKHVLYVKQAITHLPIVKPQLVAAQIHGNKADGIDDAMVLRLENQHLFLSFNGGKLRSDVTIKTDYVLGTKHEIIFEVIDNKHYVYYSEDGNLLAAYNNGTADKYLIKDPDTGTDYVMDLAYDQSYFKVGNYTQSNADKEGSYADDPNDYGEVYVYDFFVQHGDSEPIAATGVTVSPTTATIDIAGTVQLTASLIPENAVVQNISFSSSDESIATVDANGLVTGVSEGTVVITATADDSGFTATSNITVKNIPEGLTNVALNKPVIATIAADTATPEANLVDGSTDTRMSSSGYPQTVIIDLGANYDISYSELVFYKDRAYQYTIETATADDSTTFTQVVDRSSNSTSGTVSNPLTDYFTTTARYVKLTITGAAVYTGSWVSISEFRVFGVNNSGSTYTKFNIASSNEELEVYPNPIVNQFTIAVLTSKNTLYKVFDISGRVVMKGIINKTHSKIDATRLPCGVYLVRVNNKTKIIYKPSK